MSTHRIAVIGDATSVSGFAPFGIAAFVAERDEEARTAWAALVGGEYGIVFITEPVYEAIAELVAEVADSVIPAVTIIPAAGSAGGVGAAKLDRAIERALGIAIPHREEEG